ncbi:YitT family protein [Thermodesulforhabdus norvegica]|uniref:Uncharacterized membrane-anchored protein YitT, contains DUF161 and DUF2179 domains n=1 Tax=Thermodesulforhabdus norvegica TaxID=39841 RepID=A0A1I4VSF8_9BACT|nr:YitT family protein [Thermodesulforhabdus norvegica]SFN04112.1 Uncharacterized membrane-anchored protein YitT, contains DUF161 and DUF2179 domains [Thermodesulforhabdus norvegica]
MKKPELDFRSLLSNLFLISAGSIIFVMGMNSVLVPHRLLSGGVVGIAIILHYTMPFLSVGAYYFLLNIPLFLLGWYYLSFRFMAYTAYGMLIFSLLASLIRPPVLPMDDPILAALMAGVICGTGAGIVLRSLGSAGGLDVLAIVLNRRLGIRMGVVYTLCNALVLIGGGFFIGMEQALYSIIYVYTSSRVLDAVVAGFNRRKLVLIISARWQEIVDFILHRIHRGATVFRGIGAYTGEERTLIMTVTTMTELPRIKEGIFSVDPEAFIVINETLEVLGKRHGRYKVY